MASGGPAPQFASLYVGDLHAEVTEAMLYEIFNSVGPVGSIRVCRDSISRRSLGYGYVNFHNVGDAERALDTLNYSCIKGRACRIMWSQRDPSLRKSGVGNIYVKNLDRTIDNKALYDTFSLFGNILSCKAACDASGKSRGYGFVHYESEEGAKQAIERVNGMQIGEKTVEVTQFIKRSDRDSPKDNFTNIYVKNVADDFDDDKMQQMFSGFGKITSSCILEDKQGRKFAFINFETTESAKKSVEELNGKDMRTDEEKGNEEKPTEDQQLYVGRAQTKAERLREFRDKAPPGPTGVSGGRASGVNLYVKNLGEETDDSTLRELFGSFGTITSAVAMKDERSRCKGFGFVSFESPNEATKAVTEMHLKVVKGKPLYVGLAEKREARQERLRQRYSPGGVAGGKGKDMGMGKGKMGNMGPGMNMGGPQGMYGGQQGGMGGGGQGMGGMSGMSGVAGMGGMCGGMMGNPQMMGGMKGMGGPGMMCNPMMGMKGPMMGGKGPMGGMVGNPQMMGMMGGKPGGMPPQMMGMMGGMAGKGCMPGMMGGMMRPMMPPMQQPQGQLPQQQQPQQQPSPQAPAIPMSGAGPLTAAALAAAPTVVQKQMLGEKLFPSVSKYQPELAGKITGMMLEMDNSELLMLLESEQQLKSKVDEAMRVIGGGGLPA